MNARSAHELFGLQLSDVSLAEAARWAVDETAASQPRLIVTPNTDHFLRWQSDDVFRALYAHADLSVPDGMPLVWLGRLSGTQIRERVTGIDLFSQTCELAQQQRVGIAIVGGAEGVAESARSNLLSRYPTLDIYHVSSPTPAQLDDSEYVSALAAELDGRRRKIVALCLGSPKQEQLYSALRPHISDGVYMAVGAAVDFWAGTIDRAPAALQRLGLEWVYRLFREPKRLWRRYLVDDVRIVRYFPVALKRRMRLTPLDETAQP